MRYLDHHLQQAIATADGEFTFDAELQSQLAAMLQSAVLKRAHRAVLELVDPITGRPFVALERFATPVLAGLAAQHPGFLCFPTISLLTLRKETPVFVADLGVLFARKSRVADFQGQSGSLLAVPVVIDGAQVGVLSLISGRPNAFQGRDREDVISYAAIAAGLLKTRQGVDSSRSTRIAVIRMLVNIIEAKEPGVRSHLFRVEEQAVATASRLRLSLTEIQTLRSAAWLRDVGKVGVPNEILATERRLHPRELTEIRKYPILGAQILEHLPELASIVPVVRHHHEHWDGSGYPEGLVGEAIPLLSRVILVSEAYDAITSDRPYRRARSARTALREIHKESTRQFCPRVAHAFEEATREESLVQDRSLSDIILSHL